MRGLVPVLCQQSFGRIVWGVRQERGVVDEERLFFVRRHVDEVEDWLHAFPPDLQAQVTVSTASSAITVSHAMREAAAGVMAFPPFAGLMAEIAFGL